MPLNVYCTYKKIIDLFNINLIFCRVRFNFLHVYHRLALFKHRPHETFVTLCQFYSSESAARQKPEQNITVLGNTYKTDSWTNVRPKILEKVGKNLHLKKGHPLNLLKTRIEKHFYENYFNRWRNPLFSVYDNISPVVTLEQNFDSLLVPEDHISRSLSDSYYINTKYMLRAHTSAHEHDLIKSGLDAFLIFGDVYRRDHVDASHYPVFHQVEGARLFTEHQLFSKVRDPTNLKLFEEGRREPTKQESHTLEAAKLMEFELKSTLENLAADLFGKGLETKWVETYFPFTHPSWELEVKFQGEWLEVLGCGILEQQILKSAGAVDSIGWAFGLGLERLAMTLYDIPDIRLFWSEDSGFLSQFEGSDHLKPIKYKPVSKFSPCINDLSFWIPENFSENDFHDLVRNVCGEYVEQVKLIDDFKHPKTKRQSQCYRIVYRHMEKSFTKEEVNVMHEKVAKLATEELGVEIR